MAADDFCYLTTTGRRTRNPHEIQIWFAQVDDTLYMLAGGGRSSDWVRNLLANPRCTVRFPSGSWEGTGRILDPVADAAEMERARTLVFDKYQPRYEDSLYEWRERALPVAIDLHSQV